MISSSGPSRTTSRRARPSAVRLNRRRASLGEIVGAGGPDVIPSAIARTTPDRRAVVLPCGSRSGRSPRAKAGGTSVPGRRKGRAARGHRALIKSKTPDIALVIRLAAIGAGISSSTQHGGGIVDSREGCANRVLEVILSSDAGFLTRDLTSRCPDAGIDSRSCPGLPTGATPS